MPLYPFQFEPIYKAKVWGGRALERIGRSLPGGADQAIGESWEIADLRSTSPGGGGGAAAHSRITNGLCAGQTLHDLLDRLPKPIMGMVELNEDAADRDASSNASGGAGASGGAFPLLIKYLDARQNLSVQVHPSEAYAEEHPDAHLKSEAWYIVDADPSAVIYKGVREGVTPKRYREAIGNGTVEELLIAVEARAGDCHYLPSGTCHALGAGIVVAEVQTPSDTTFRVYDWGREGRELHVDRAMACIHFGPAETERYEPGTKIRNDRATVESLVHCEHFRIEKIAMNPTDGTPLVMNDQPRIWMVLEGGGTITCKNGGCDETPFQRGDTLLLPAEMDRPRLHLNEGATWLEVSFPQAMAGWLA